MPEERAGARKALLTGSQVRTRYCKWDESHGEGSSRSVEHRAVARARLSRRRVGSDLRGLRGVATPGSISTPDPPGPPAGRVGLLLVPPRPPAPPRIQLSATPSL